MRSLRRLLLAASFVGLSASAGLAQQQTVTTTPGGQTSSTITGTGGQTGGQAGQLGGSQLGGISLQQLQAAPTISAPTGTTGGTGSTDPVLGPYFANPYYQGLLANIQAAPGGFGTPLYGTTGGTGATGRGGGIGARTTPTGVRTGGTTGTTGLGGTTTGLGGATTGLAGGRTGGLTGGGLAGGRTGGLGGAGLGGLNVANQAAVVVPLQAQITYPAVPQFRSAPLAAPQVQADVSGMLARSVGTLSNPAGVQVTVGEGNGVVLRGTVRDAEEARLVEGMVRLTPGVGSIKNELTFPAPARP